MPHVRFKFDIGDAVVEVKPREGFEQRRGMVTAVEYSRKGNAVIFSHKKQTYRELEQNLELSA